MPELRPAAASAALLSLLLAGPSPSQAQSSPAWQPLPASPSPNRPPEPRWQPLPPASGDGPPAAPTWVPLPPSTDKPPQPPQWLPLSEPLPEPVQPPSSRFRPPTSQKEAEALLRQLQPQPSDYLPLLRLGPAVPTANTLPAMQGQVSVYQLAPFGGGGAAGGTGNQNYAARLDAALSDQLLLSAFYTYADDPLYAPIPSRSPQPANYWRSYGGSLQWQLLKPGPLKFALSGSLESWTVGSGGCDSFSCQGQNTYSPNIFNSSGSRVQTNNLVGSIAVPLSWQASPQWQFTFTPCISFLPASQGANQGGAGPFYGNSFTLAGGLSWRPLPQLTLFSSGLVPLGPGSNSFNANLQYGRVPIFSGGVNVAINPSIALEALLTNGWGATPATALLALPSSNRLGTMARFIWNPAAADAPQPEMSPRQQSIALGGLTVNTAYVPPRGTNQFWANGDSLGNIFAMVGASVSSDFQFQYSGGVFNGISPVTSLSSAYASPGGYNYRYGGKAVVLNQLRGAPFSAAGRITVGRNTDPSSYQGYLFFETINTWEVSPTVALNLNPKIAWSGVSSPWGLGLSANLQLGQSFQLIPELNIVPSSSGGTNGTFALRWLANRNTSFDLYLSNAAGLLDMGQLLGNGQVRVGGRLLLTF